MRIEPRGTEKFRIQKTEEWLNKNWPMAKNCPICKRNEWATFGTIHELHEFQGPDFVPDAPKAVFPVVPVVCGHCGYTLIFSALKLGLIKRSKKEGGKKNGQ